MRPSLNTVQRKITGYYQDDAGDWVAELPANLHLVRTLDFLDIDRVHGENAQSSADQVGDPACWAGLVCDQCGAVFDGSNHRAGCSEAGEADGHVYGGGG